ncbi:Aldo/keto reductase [Scheffersomyces stipitis CBS 6054]|uniref:2-dehydropantolactone reductase n=1 Tax=Scheffersomyces stipitis (strain ATCC 58785 / CBS 6054 / NBRC 10063 / NRRL Y-11545) TaxID=322104 RepID=A3LRU9_PICST|nr:Aldo/keto reductase [Scheffersomyces stipitis CBS 6054]ABN65453.1 Aldo/keto reductase [Scheffersomyces stipitis CBS 6054]
MPATKATKVFQLNDETSIPGVGLGTWQSTNDEVYNAVLTALRYGYRHIDTAAAYGNESVIGRAIKDSGIPREELYITTKLWCTKHDNPEAALDESLSNLGLDYVDLYLIHWPVFLNPNGNDPKFPTLPNGKRDIVTDWNFVKTYELLQPLVALGKTKSIGVSNFSVTNLEKLLNAPTTKIVPVVNQVELHPYLPQQQLLEYTKKHGIVLEAYSPLGSTNSPLFKDETVVKIAEKNGVSPATILISWALWRGTVVLPKSVTESRVQSNFEVINLSDEDGQTIDNIHKVKGVHRFINPNWDPVVVFDADSKL